MGGGGGQCFVCLFQFTYNFGYTLVDMLGRFLKLRYDSGVAAKWLVHWTLDQVVQV